MKRIIFIFLALLTVAHAQWGAVLTGSVASAPPPTYLVDQDFETDYSGPPPSWNQTNGLGFYSATSPAPLQGAHSAQSNNSNQDGYIDFTAQADVWAFDVMNPGPEAGARAIVLTDGSGVDLGQQIYVTTWYGGWRLVGGGQDVSFGTSATNTTYYVWLHYVKGTGSNCFCEVYISSTTTKPGSPSASFSNGSQTNNMSRFYLAGGSVSGPVTWDYVRVSSSVIGSAPP